MLLSAILLFVIGLLVGKFIFPNQQTGTWLTMQMKVSSGAEVYADDVDLKLQHSTPGWLFTYFQCSWVELEFDGGYGIFTNWNVKPQFQLDNPRWQEGLWTVDFYWPDSMGDWPPGAEPGTSQHSCSPNEQTGDWLTMELSPNLTTSTVHAIGIDLWLQNHTPVWLHTYCICEWVALEFDSGSYDSTTWNVPSKFQKEHPNWRDGYWYVRFYWPKRFGSWPVGAKPLTFDDNCER